MRWFVPWLLMLGLLTGQTSRLAGEDPCERAAAVHHGCHSHEDGHEEPHPCSSEHDKNCPLDHHHSVGCIHTMPMATGDHHVGAARHLPFSLSPVRDDEDAVPDAPCHELDKPPLI